MAKRFTDTAIWQDEWFMSLCPEYKLAYMFVKDNCDQAGIWRPNMRLADMMIGCPVNWDDFLLEARERVKIVSSGYWWLTKFCDFQYGTLSEKCKPHIKVIEILKKYQLLDRVCKGYTNPIQGVEEKEEDKEKEKETEEEKEDTPKIEIFYPYNSEKFLSAWGVWLDYRKEIKKPYKSKKSEQAALKQLSEFDEEFCVHLIETSIAGCYQGLVFTNTKADYLKLRNGKQTGTSQTNIGNKLNGLITAKYGNRSSGQ